MRYCSTRLDICSNRPNTCVSHCPIAEATSLHLFSQARLRVRRWLRITRGSSTSAHIARRHWYGIPLDPSSNAIRMIARWLVALISNGIRRTEGVSLCVGAGLPRHRAIVAVGARQHGVLERNNGQMPTPQPFALVCVINWILPNRG